MCVYNADSGYQVILLASTLSSSQFDMKGGMKSVTMMGGLCCFQPSLSLAALPLWSANTVCSFMVRALQHCHYGLTVDRLCS